MGARLVETRNHSSYDGDVLSAVCSHCNSKANFTRFSSSKDIKFFSPIDERTTKEFAVGIRICPDRRCNGIMFLLYDQEKVVINQYPVRDVEFDGTDVPDSIASTFSEAVKCHSHHFHTAAAIMIRRTLEEVCDHFKCTGNNLHERLETLGDKDMVIPKNLMEAAFELKMLGNDAAHIESKKYENIGAEEIELAVSLTKEILKAAFQLEGLVVKLQNLQKAS